MPKSETRLTEEQLDELYKTIDYNPNEGSLSYPDSFQIFNFEFKLKKGYFRLIEKPHEKSCKELLTSIFTDTRGSFIQRPSGSASWSIQLDEMTCTDGYSENTQFPTIIKPKKLQTQLNQPFFEFLYEVKPLNSKCDSLMKLHMLPLLIIFNDHYIKQIINFFSRFSIQPDTLDLLKVILILVLCRINILRMLRQTNGKILKNKLEQV